MTEAARCIELQGGSAIFIFGAGALAFSLSWAACSGLEQGGGIGNPWIWCSLRAILLDGSALVCSLLQESGAERRKALIRISRLVVLGIPMMLESEMFLWQRTHDGRHALDGFLRECRTEFLDFRREHTAIPMSAFLRFGMGRYPAALNFGDCNSYSYTKLSALTPLCNGSYLGQTHLAKPERLDTENE